MRSVARVSVRLFLAAALGGSLLMSGARPVAADAGATSNSVASEGATSNSVAPEGATSNSVAPEGATSNSVAPEGATSNSVAPEGATSNSVAPEGATSNKVVLIAAPRLTWDRVNETDSPNIWKFLQESAVASMSVRTIGKITEPHEAYLTIGAGNRAGGMVENAVETWDASGEVLDADELLHGRTASEIHRQQTGAKLDQAKLVALGFPAVLRANDDLNYGSKPGALGTALSEAGKTVSVLGNADAGLNGPAQAAPVAPLARQAGLAVVDRRGRIAAGEVGSELLEAKEDAAFGVQLSRSSYSEALTTLISNGDMTLLELSDLERAERAGLDATDRQRARLRVTALSRSDELFGDARAEVERLRAKGSKVTVVLFGPTSPVDDQQLTVFAVQGPEFRTGFVQSASTRRPGMVTLTDLAPTILRELGVDVPKSMGDTPLEFAGARPGWSDTVDQLRYTNTRAVFVLRIHDPLAAVFVALIVFLVVAAVAMVYWRPSWYRYLKAPSIFLISVPAASYLMGCFRSATLHPVAYSLVIAALSALIGAGTYFVTGRRASRTLVAISALTWLLLSIDIALGGWLQLDTIFGYSPIVAGRFAGFGNLSFALFAVTAIVVATIGLFGWLGDPSIDATRRRIVTAGVVLVGLAAIVVDGAPMLGSDVGGVLSLVPVFGLLALYTSGIRIRPWTVLAAGATAVGVLTAFALFDLSQPAESRTHLGRFAAKVADGGAGLILERKIHANLSLLTSSVWSMTIPAAFVLVATLNFRPTGILRRLQESVPGFKVFGAALLLCGLTGMVVNDSGIAVPAMMFAFAIPGTIALLSEIGSVGGDDNQHVGGDDNQHVGGDDSDRAREGTDALEPGQDTDRPEVSR